MDTCFKEILATEIYIGIIDLRFGSVDQATGNSFTQLEYDAAYNAGKQILIYVIDDYSGAVSLQFIDFVNHVKLEGFVKVLRERHTADKFLKATDLHGKLKVAIIPLLHDESIERFRPESINCKITRLEGSKIR